MIDFDRPCLLAIGYQKTGSTWLDRHLWSNSEIGFHGCKSAPLRDVVVAASPFDFNLEDARKHISRSIGDIPAGKLPAFGHERLSGSPHSGGHDSKHIADRLCAIFPQGRILIVVRNQPEIILSTYRQSVLGGNSMTLQQYLTNPQPGRYAIPQFDFARFKFDRLVRYYRALVGSDRLCVLPYEMFRDNPREFVKKILQFSGLAENAAAIEKLSFTKRERAATSPWVHSALRQFNTFFGEASQFTPHPVFETNFQRRKMKHRLERIDRKLPSWMKPDGRRTKARMMAEIHQHIDEMYETSNALLQDDIGIDLAQYGYALPSDMGIEKAA